MARRGHHGAGRRCQLRLTRANVARGGGERQPGAQRRVTQPALQVQGQGEEQAAERGHHREQGRDAHRHPGPPQDPARDERMPAAGREPALREHEAGEQHHAAGQRGPAPGGPVLGLAQDQRHDQGEHRRRQGEQARQVQAPADARPARAAATARPRPAAPRRSARSPGTPAARCSPSRFAVISRPPAICPTTTPPASTAEYARIAPGPGRAGEGALDQAEHLRDHRRRAGALDEPQRDQHARGGGQPAAERGQREHRQPGQEHAAVAEDVTQPRAGHQQHRVGDRRSRRSRAAGPRPRRAARRGSTGAATFTTEASRTAMNWPMSTIASSVPGLGPRDRARRPGPCVAGNERPRSGR